jgi:mono/diheme cytochrome c family protein
MRYLALMVWLSLISLSAAAQRLPGNPDAGRKLAERSCAQCHLIDGGEGQRAMDNVPTFAALARDPSMTQSRLQGFMQVPHPRMPEPALTRREIDDVTSYILSLRQR